MTRKPLRLAIALALLAGLPAGAGAADPDPLEARLAAAQPWRLRWDNLEGAPYWLAGAAPAAHRESGLAVVELQPGEVTALRLPAGSWLRIRRADGEPLAPQALEMERDDGSGLALAEPPRVDREGREWFLRGDPERLQVVHLSRPRGAKGALQLALFLSRTEGPGTVAPYRQALEPEGAAVELSDPDAALSERFHPLGPDRPLELELEGPLRIAVDSRLAFAPHDADPVRPYRITALLDGEPLGQRTDRSKKTGIATEAQRTQRGLEPQEPGRADEQLCVLRASVANPGCYLFEHETAADDLGRLLVEGTPRLLGRPERGYLELPAGRHRLRLTSEAQLLVRLLAQEQPGYLFPALNAPDPDAEQLRRELPAPPSPAWLLAEPALAALMAGDDLAGQTAALRRIAADNSRREGGLLAVALAEQLAARHPQAPQLLTLAAELAGRHTFYRELLPASPVAAQRFAWFTPRTPAAPGEARPPPVAAEQHLPALLARLASGHFAPIPGVAEPLRYSLPEHPFPGRLRLAVTLPPAGERAELWLQLDDAPPRRLRVGPAPLPADELLPGDGELGLALLAALHEDGDPLGAPFAAHRPAAPRLGAATHELPLPAGTRTLRLWQGAGPQLSVALHARAGRPAQLPEPALLAATSLLGDRLPALFRAALADPDAAARPLPGEPQALALARADLVNHWRPLARRLAARAADFAAAVARPPAPGPAAGDVAGLADSARRLAREGEWLAAAEAWSAVARSRGPLRPAALWGQTQALRQLGEGFLADRLLRSAALFDAEPALRAEAFNRLADHYRAQGDGEQLITLLAAAALGDGTTGRWQALAEALLAGGEAADALSLLLALPPAEQPPRLLVRAALQAQAWHSFEAALPRLTAAEQRLWQGVRGVREGRWEAALAHLRAAGAAGSPHAEAVEEGLALRSRLRHLPAAPLRSDWERWQVALPGPPVPRAADHLITAHAGTALLYSPGREAYATLYRAEPGRPLRVELAGPARLRLSARPLHAAARCDGEGRCPALEGWLRLRDGEGEERLAISGNIPTRGLTLTGDPDQLPGVRVAADLDLGPGLHRLALEGEGFPLLIELERMEPELWPGLLPPLSPLTLAAAGQNAPAAPSAAYALVNGEGGPRLIDLPLPPLAPAPDPAPIPMAIAPARFDLPAPLREMQGLIARAEGAPAERARALAEGEALAARHPLLDDLRPLLARLRRESAWEPVAVTAAAGFRLLPADSAPESPALRLRHALMGGGATAQERLLTGEERLLLATRYQQPRRVTLTARHRTLPFLPGSPLTLIWQGEGGAAGRRLLAPGESATLAIDLPAGAHQLRLWLAQPQPNQLVALRIDAGPDEEPRERSWQVATRAEPVRIDLTGPGWLRIDEWREGMVRVAYRLLAPGWQSLAFTPAAGREEALYRFFLRRPAPPIPEPPARPAGAPPRPVPLPAVAAPLPAPAGPITIEDELALGRQEDGTWSAGLAWVERSEPEEARQRSERFLEAALDYRYHDPLARLWLHGTLLAREREHGGNSFGLLGRLEQRPESQPYAFELAAAFYLQDPGEPFCYGDRATEWSALVRGSASARFDLSPVSYHLPAVALFGRALSLTEDRYAPGDVDQDIFTAYKADHRFGVELSESWVTRPWLDSRALLRASAVLNPELDSLDHLEARARWNQRLGAAQLDLGYSAARYLADERRADDYDRHTLGLGLSWNQRRPGGDRLELSLDAAHELTEGENSLRLGVTWHAAEGRALRDFRPGEITFPDLDTRAFPTDRNRLTEESP